MASLTGLQDRPGDVTGLYKEHIRNKIYLFGFFLVALLGLTLYAVAAGTYDLTVRAIVRALIGHAEGAVNIVVWNIRMPRIAAAIVAGWCLGLSGAVMQCLLKNPLASPFTLGISQGAAFGAAFAIVVLGAGGAEATAQTSTVQAVSAAGPMTIRNIYSVTACAFLGSLAGTIAIVSLARLKKMAAESIILAGVALSSLFVSGTILVQYFATEVEIASVVFWTFGDVGRSNWREISVMASATLLVTIYFVLRRWDLNALAAGEDVARSLGVNVDKSRALGHVLDRTHCCSRNVVSWGHRFLGPARASYCATFDRWRSPLSHSSQLHHRRAFVAHCRHGEPHVSGIRHSPCGGPHLFHGGAVVSLSPGQGSKQMILSVNQIDFKYNSIPVLRDVTFELPAGKVLGVLGINGAGKSTLLKCINKVLRPNGGSILLDGTDVLQLRGDAVARRIGYVPQRYGESQVTVFDAVLLGRKPHIKWAATERDMRVVERLLTSMGLEDYALRPITTLSGGEAQKVVIARALAQEPKVLLLDEPTSSLDMRNQLEVMNLVSAVARTEGVATVVAIHDLNLALRFVDRFLMIKDGTIHAMGPKDALTSEVIEEVYGVHSILRVVEGFPVIIPIHCCRPVALEEGVCG